MNKKKEYLLIALLIIAAFIIRLMYTHQTDFDSYWIHGMAESIDIYGYAQWIFHPMSLFGYYPLSYPSADMFFLAFISSITGLSMSNTILITGIFAGLLSTVLVFLLGRMLAGFLVGYLAAFIFAFSPQIVYYSSDVATGRFFVLIWYMVFLVLMIKILQMIGLSFFNTHRTYNKKRDYFRLAKYLFSEFLILIVAFMSHRTSQLIAIFIIAALCTFLMSLVEPIWSRIMGFEGLRRFLQKRYGSFNKRLFLDIFIILFFLALLKFLDLFHRGRLLINIQRRLPKFITMWVKFTKLMASHQNIAIVIACVLVLIPFAVFVFLRMRRIHLIKRIHKSFSVLYDRILMSPKRYFYISLMIIAILFFIMQFFGRSFYSPSLSSYEQSELITGNAPYQIFLNFVINYTTSVTIFSIFSVISFFYIFLKKEKDSSEIFLVFVILGFIGLLIDKNYLRLFITPVFAVLCAYGIILSYNFFSTRIRKQSLNLAMAALIVIGLFAAFTPQTREIYSGKNAVFKFYPEFWETGQYLRSLDCNCSTVTTLEQKAAVTIFASSGVPGGSHNIYYFVNQSYLQPNKLNLSKVIDKLKNGDKVTDLWYLPDWIFGGQYYNGRHTRLLYGAAFNSEKAQRIVNDYNEEYYIHDKSLPENKFYESIVPVFNKVYDNELTNVHSIKKGRVLL